MAKAAPGGTRGLFAIETGLRTLAFEAVGVQGPIGRVAEGLLKFGGGSGLVLGAAAGIGLIAGAYRLASAEAKELAATNDRLNKSWADLVGRGKSTVALTNELNKASADLEVQQEKLASLSATVPTPHGPVARGTTAEIAEAQANVDAGQRVLDEIHRQLQAGHAQLIADANKLGEKFVTAFISGIANLEPGSRIAALTQAQPQFTAAGGDAGKKWTGAFVAAVADLAPDQQLRTLLAAQPKFAKMGTEAGQAWSAAYLQALQAADWRPTPRRTIRGGVLGNLEGFDLRGEGALALAAHRPLKAEEFGAGFALAKPDPFTFDAIDRHVSRFPASDKPEKGKVDYAAIAAESVALIGAMKEGGAGGVLSSAGALAGTLGAAKTAGGLGLAGLGPVGIGLQVAGGLFSLLDNSAERRHREQVALLKRIAEKPNPEAVRVQPIFVGASPANAADVAYQVGRFQDRDGVPRGVGS